MVKTCKGTVIMRKGIDESKVQRMRNIVSGDYSKRVNIRSGYTTKRIKRVEGDVWEEKGKTWTIKDGIKENITKLDKFKKVAVPIFCPKCKKNMDSQLDPHYYKSYGECVDCRAVTETKLKKEGKWKEYINTTFNKEIDINIEEYKSFMEDMLSESNNNFITEAGDIQKWVGGVNKKRAKSAMEESIKYLKNLKK